MALFPAANQGMADPEKWAPLVERISDLHCPENTQRLRDDEALALEGLIREATRSVADLRAACVRVAKRLANEPPPEQNEATIWATAINGVPYDPRTSTFRGEVKRISRPLYDHLSAVREVFQDYTSYMPDHAYNVYNRGNWKARRTLSKLYNFRSFKGYKPWWWTRRIR